MVLVSLRCEACEPWARGLPLPSSDPCPAQRQPRDPCGLRWLPGGRGDLILQGRHPRAHCQWAQWGRHHDLESMEGPPPPVASPFLRAQAETGSFCPPRQPHHPQGSLKCPQSSAYGDRCVLLSSWSMWGEGRTKHSSGATTYEGKVSEALLGQAAFESLRVWGQAGGRQRGRGRGLLNKLCLLVQPAPAWPRTHQSILRGKQRGLGTSL